MNAKRFNLGLGGAVLALSLLIGADAVAVMGEGNPTVPRTHVTRDKDDPGSGPSDDGPIPVPPPCHPVERQGVGIRTVVTRGDVRSLPEELQDRLQILAGLPHSILPVQARAEADAPSQLFQYYLLDAKGFQPNVFTTTFPGINDQVMLTAEGGNCGLSTLGAVRLVVEPKPGLPTDPNDVRAFVDIFTDIFGLFVINNESGWYEGWMIHDLTVAPVDDMTRPDGHARFGAILSADATALAAMGGGNNVAGHTFTLDGNPPRLPTDTDHFPDVQSNLVPIQLSMGAYNCLQQADCHSYWEFNYTTNWIHPLYELPFTGGLQGAFEADKIGAFPDIVPGPGPDGPQNDPVAVGDDPNLPRDPDKFDGDDDAQREFRQRFIPSGLANEIFLDTYERVASFEPGVAFPQRLFDAYKAEVERVAPGNHGIVSAVIGDVDNPTDGYPDNTRLFLPPTVFNRFAVTREINDGILAPRFAPSQRAWLLTGAIHSVSPAVPASEGRDSDDR